MSKSWKVPEDALFGIPPTISDNLFPEGVYFMLVGEDAGKTGASGKMVILR